MKEIAQLKSEPLKPCADAFRCNLNRTMAFAVLPVELIYQTAREERIQANAIFRATGRGDIGLFDAAALRYEKHDELNPHLIAQVGEYAKYDREPDRTVRISFGGSIADQMLATNRGMQSSIDALYTSIVLESWLFFEALAADLWVAAVDAGGAVISGRMLANQKWEKDREDMKAANVPAMPVNPKTHPGSYWREIGMVSFQKLEKIRSYFEIAFGDEIKKAFDADAGYIYALNGVRNCIIHRAGKADAQFISRMQRFPEFRSMTQGARIELDGEIVNRLRNASLLTGRELLRCVDAMLLRGD